MKQQILATIFTAVLLLAFSTLAPAQNGGGGGGDIASYPAFMAKFDTNKNSQIDVEEQFIVDAWYEQRWQAYFAALPQDQKQVLLTRFDTNKDGRIDTQEWVALDAAYQTRWQTRFSQLSPEAKQQVIAQFDSNRNGLIDGQEYRFIVLPAPATQVQVVRRVTTVQQALVDMPDALAKEHGAERKFSKLFQEIRKFSLVIILIGTVIAGVLFVMQKPQMAIGVFAAAIIIGGAPTVIELIYTALQ